MAVQPKARLRADEGVFEDAAGTDPAEDTDPVVRWDYAAASELTGNASQSEVARQPVFVADDGGDPAVRFTEDVLIIPHDADWTDSTQTLHQAIHELPNHLDKKVREVVSEKFTDSG